MNRDISTPLLAPHRAFFLLGTATLMLSLGGWLLQLAAPRPVAAPPGWLHGWLMVFGALGPFICGFLFTAYSRWLGTRSPSRATWLGSLLLQALGLAALSIGGGAGGPGTMAAAALLLGGWGLVLSHLLRAVHSGQGARLHGWSMIGATAAGCLALLLLFTWGATGNARFAGASLATAQWGFLLPVYLVVSHRMFPFFAGCVLEPYRPYRPPWALIAALSLSALHLGLVLAGATAWLWLADLPLCLLGTWLAVHWQPWRARGNHLLLSLFICWAALVAGLGLLALQSAWLLATAELIGGRGPAHVINIGFFGAMLLAMGTRVTLGHSGRPLVMDRVAWVALWIVVGAAAMRALADVAPAPRGWLLASSAAWLLATGAWALRYAPMLWRPRVDGLKR